MALAVRQWRPARVATTRLPSPVTAQKWRSVTAGADAEGEVIRPFLRPLTLRLQRRAEISSDPSVDLARPFETPEDATRSEVILAATGCRPCGQVRPRPARKALLRLVGESRACSSPSQSRNLLGLRGRPRRPSHQEEERSSSSSRRGLPATTQRNEGNCGSEAESPKGRHCRYQRQPRQQRQVD